MKNFRRICFAMVLTMAFMVPAWAGDVQAPAAPNPGDIHIPGAPAPGDVQAPAAPAPGDIQSPGAPTAGDMGNGLAVIMFALQIALR